MSESRLGADDIELVDEIISILDNLCGGLLNHAIAKTILEKVWASREFVERAEEYCKEMGWCWPE